MVATLIARGRPAGYIRRLQAAFAPSDQLAPLASPDVDRHALTPIEPLTWREQDVLQQLGRRLSNKEIAVELDISPLTVKKHAESIYRKLHVNGRRDAITRAQALGLL
jgi:ATP/maltotriose-dependent transcriptional regulator MalT